MKSERDLLVAIEDKKEKRKRKKNRSTRSKKARSIMSSKFVRNFHGVDIFRKVFMTNFMIKRSKERN